MDHSSGCSKDLWSLHTCPVSDDIQETLQHASLQYILPGLTNVIFRITTAKGPAETPDATMKTTARRPSSLPLATVMEVLTLIPTTMMPTVSTVAAAEAHWALLAASATLAVSGRIIPASKREGSQVSSRHLLFELVKCLHQVSLATVHTADSLKM